MEGLTVELVTQFISSVGFPIFIAIWLLYERRWTQKILETRIEKMNQILTELLTYLKAKNGS